MIFEPVHIFSPCDARYRRGCVPEHGWVKPERLGKQSVVTGATKFPDWWQPDIPSRGINYSYLSGYILPFHYYHPVTGKKTSEGLRNTSVEGATKD